MSRFDRRLKGVEKKSDGSRPGTSSCRLPTSSVHSGSMLGGMLYNSNTLLTRQNNIPSRQNNRTIRQNNRQPMQNNMSNRQNTKISRQQSQRGINGVAVLKDHDDKIKRLENRLQELESNYVINLSKMEQKIQEKDKLFSLMRGDYKEEMRKMREYIKSLHQKMKVLDELEVNVKPDIINIISDKIETSNIEQETSEEIAKKTDQLVNQTISEKIKNNITFEVIENE